MDGKLVQRANKVAFYGVPGSGSDVTYSRMQGFTELSQSKNAMEYSRQYVDELFEQTDVVGYSPSISYNFDEYTDNAVQEDIVSITDREVVGSDAVRKILLVDMTNREAAADSCPAIMREFAVIPDGEGDSMEAYTYSGTFRAKGALVYGNATVSADGTTATFTPAS